MGGNDFGNLGFGDTNKRTSFTFLRKEKNLRAIVCSSFTSYYLSGWYFNFKKFYSNFWKTLNKKRKVYLVLGAILMANLE